MKKLLSVSLLITLSFSLFAFDWGGTFSNTSKFADQTPDDGLKLEQKNALTLWGKTPFGEKNYFLAQAKYQFEHNFGADETINAIDLNIAKIEIIKDDLTINAGRFFYSDLSNIIYTQNGDGLLVSLSKTKFNAKAYGFYTGLLNSHFVTILGDSDKIPDNKKLYDTCQKYAVAGLQASFPAFWKEQSLSAEFIWTARLTSEKLNRGYTELSLNGPLTEGLFYQLTGVLGLLGIEGEDMKISNLSKAELTYYPNFKDSQISLNTVYTTGNPSEENSKKVGFSGFTSNTAIQSLEEEEYTSIFMTGLSSSIKPIPSLLLSAGFDAVFNTNENKCKYRGFQYDTRLYYQIVSDVLIGADFTQYFDTDNSDINKTALTIKASITF